MGKIVENRSPEYTQNTSSNEISCLVRIREDLPDSLDFWTEAYFQVEVTISQRSQAKQKRERLVKLNL